MKIIFIPEKLVYCSRSNCFNRFLERVECGFIIKKSDIYDDLTLELVRRKLITPQKNRIKIAVANYMVSDIDYLNIGIIIEIYY